MPVSLMPAFHVHTRCSHPHKENVELASAGEGWCRPCWWLASQGVTSSSTSSSQSANVSRTAAAHDGSQALLCRRGWFRHCWWLAMGCGIILCSLRLSLKDSGTDAACNAMKASSGHVVQAGAGVLSAGGRLHRVRHHLLHPPANLQRLWPHQARASLVEHHCLMTHDTADKSSTA